MNEWFLTLRNAEAARIADVPVLPPPAFRNAILDCVSADDSRVVSLFGRRDGDRVELIVVMADDAAGELGLIRTRLSDARFESLAADLPQLQLFEREIAEQFDVTPHGHPWLKPVRAQAATTPFFRVSGEEVHEVAVGPVHAGVIEPGHFRFQCHGEQVFHLEIALGYQHRGIERALAAGPSKKTVHMIETIAGDTTVGHSLAYAQAIEALSRTKPPARAHALRGIALELERLANHCGDLGALAGDVAYLPTASFCGRIRGDYLNATADLCGSRFGRGFVRPGGVGFDIESGRVQKLADRVDVATRDAVAAIKLLWSTPTVVERFENTGTVAPETAEEIGLVGVAARACGRGIDVRHDFPYGIYRFVHVPVMTAHHGDVNSRAFVRWLELQRSAEFVIEQLRTLPATAVRRETGALASDSIVVSLTEGWRGEVCHVALTDANGRFARYKVTDPSFHNWFALALALRDGQISDFPLCNKSFNLSYCGHDL
ncbi:MAG TPA: hydrogenase [Thermoanaerobaculia bacterium]|nr:hydrogenase [Thermoanaerobaculia bacterium]